MHLSFKCVCNKEHKAVICNMTLSNSSQSTFPVGQVLWEESLILSRFHLLLRAGKLNFCPLTLLCQGDDMCSPDDYNGMHI